eukprot:snap_masked-scaffold_51-processed-gene-1.55-mRNA-1 protein AED:1.00 eAED:1.00 QI:0/-1/0/0/-1/1/1/0/101
MLITNKTIEKLKENHERKQQRKSKDILESKSYVSPKVHTRSVLSFLLNNYQALSLLISKEFKELRGASDIVSENTMRSYINHSEYIFAEKINEEVENKCSL